MAYEFTEHTSDIRMRVTGRTLDDLFRSALLGMMAALGPGSPIRGEGSLGSLPMSAVSALSAHPRRISFSANDATALLIDFLNEALGHVHAAREVYTGVRFESLSETELVAELCGYVTDAFDEDIKAVTYHEAHAKRTKDGGWETTIIFDL